MSFHEWMNRKYVVYWNNFKRAIKWNLMFFEIFRSCFEKIVTLYKKNTRLDGWSTAKIKVLTNG